MRVTEHNHEITLMPLSGEYYAEFTTLYKPSYPQSGVLTLIYKINVDSTEELVFTNVSIHNQQQREVFNFPEEDGYYKIVSYILPTKEGLQDLDLIDGVDDIKYNNYWRRREDGADNIIKNETAEILAVDETSDSQFSCLIRKPNPVPNKKSSIYYWACFESLDDVIRLLTARESSQNYVYGTNIQVIEEYYFKYNNLYKCLLQKATELLDLYRGCGSKNSGICSDDTSCNNRFSNQQIQIRDYIWMVLNAIKYAVELEDYITANNLLNCISTCNGICNNGTNTKSTTKKSSGCGCS